MLKNLTSYVLLWILLVGCNQPKVSDDSVAESNVIQEIIPPQKEGVTVRTAGFVALETVFNSELMAPFDVFHHSVFRDTTDYIVPFIVAPTLSPITTFEGIQVQPHYTLDTAPTIDILVIPSTNNSMSKDLQNEKFMIWLKQAVEQASYVITVCDGAFPLAQTGALNGRKATTFPGDREALKEMFPEIEVLFDKRLVADGKFITSVGGGMSYEPAFYLVEKLYSKAHATQTAEGLVWDWNLSDVPHLVNSAEN